MPDDERASSAAKANTEYWDRQAPTYDTRTTFLERRYFAGCRRWVCERARGRTLEVAVGTGATFPYYSRDVELTGVDTSGVMVGLARRRAEQRGLRVDLRQAEAAALPFPAGNFDTVVIMFGLCCVPEVRAALHEAVRVLRPEGNLLLADHVVSTSWPLRILQHAVDLVTVPRQGEHYARRPLTVLRTLDVDIVESERLTRGIIERVHARTSR